MVLLCAAFASCVELVSPPKYTEHPGEGNHNQDHAGSLDEETGQRKLDDFGIKRQRVEFVGDVQEHNDDSETPRVDRAAHVFLCSQVQNVMTDWPDAKFVEERYFRCATE